MTEIEWLRALHFTEVRLPIKGLNDALHKASRKLWKRVGQYDFLTVAGTFVPMRLDQGQLQVSLKVAEVHLDQMQGKSSFGTWYKDAEVGNMIVKVMHTYARQQVERLGLT